MKYFEVLFQISIQSFTLFQLCWTSSGVTIISYPELEKDFVEFMNEYKYFQNENELPSPFSKEIVEELQQVCQDLRYARTFEIIDPNKKTTGTVKEPIIIDYARSEDITGQNIVEYDTIKVTIDDFEYNLPMFPCYKDGVYGYIYITPAFSQDFKFLFKQKDLRSNPIIYALVEPRPVIDDSLRDQRHLEKYFVQAYRMYEPKSKNRLSQSTLNGNQHYRLCSILEDARRIYAQTLPMEDTADASVSEIEHHLEFEEIVDITFRGLDKLNPVYATLEVQVATLLCHSSNGNFSFFVSENPRDANSVFLLETRTNPDSRRREIFVVQHVRDIALLRNIDTFYRK